MSKVILSPIVGGQGSVEALNANFQLLQTVINSLLSRDGASPNQMEAPLDMNNQRIYNLPNALNENEPLTKGQFDSLTEPPVAYVPAPHSHDWADITGEPTTWPPAPHTHVVADVSGLNTTLTDLQNDVSALEAEPTIWVQATQPTTPAVNDIWLW